MYKLVFDVQCKFNRHPSFFRLEGCLRTEIRQKETSLDNIPGLLNMDGRSIPGYRIEIDREKNCARIIDRMHLPENEEKNKLVRNALLRDENTLVKEFGPTYETKECLSESEHEFTDGGPGNLASWLWWCRRMYDEKKLILVEGKVPTLDDIRRIGDVHGGSDWGLTPKPGKSIGSILEQTGKRTDKKEPALQSAS